MENLKSQKQLSNGLQFFGILLFSLGLFSGLFIPLMANPRMGLSAHLEGIMNGIFLVILGFLWNKLSLSEIWFLCKFRGSSDSGVYRGRTNDANRRGSARFCLC
jgi:hydroxylaminobenzene mutase